MNSFYGGKQGRTYHIVQRFDCVNINSFEAEYIDQYNEGKLIEQQIDSIPIFPIQEQTSYLKGEVYKIQNSDSAIYYLIIEDFDLIGVDDATLKRQVLLEHSSEIKAMVQEFQKGGAYTRVNYGQYVIIDTIKNRNHKSDLENGLLFRRGFDYNQTDIVEKPDIKDEQFYSNDEYHIFDKIKWQAAWSAWVENVGGGAIYVGQIVGPQGDTPQLVPITWEQLQDKKDYSYQEVSPVSETYGWTQEDGYNDTVKVATVTLKDNDGNITGANLAFDIPQPTIIVSAQSVNAYGSEAVESKDRTRTHEDIASGKKDSNIQITVIHQDNDPTKKIIGYENLVHLHTATGKDGWVWQYEEGWDETMPEHEQHRQRKNISHPFYYNYDIAIPRGIHGQDIVSVQEESAEDIIEEPLEYTYDVRQVLYNIFKRWEYEPGYSEDSPDAEQHRHAIYWQKDDEGFDPDIHTTIIYYQEGDADLEGHKHLVTEQLDGEEKKLIAGDQYLTFSLKSYDSSQTGSIINSHAGRFPYRVINKIIQNIKDRIIFTGGSPKIGDLYQYNNSNFFAICIQAGEQNQGANIINHEDLQSFFGEQTPDEGTIIGATDNDKIHSRWRILNLQEQAPPESLTIDYKAGQNSAPIETHFLDYFYMDDSGHVYAAYSDGRKSQIGFINAITGVRYQIVNNKGSFIFDFSNRQSEILPVNLPLDIKRFGDELAILYSDQAKAIEEAEQGVPYRIVRQDGQDDKYYKILANTTGAYHVQGQYDLIDLVKYTKESGEQFKGKLFDGIENFGQGNEDRAGWIISIKEQYNGEDTVSLYAYDYNVDNYIIDQQGNYLPPYTIDILDEQTGAVISCPTYWYKIEGITFSNIDPSYFYLIDKQRRENTPNDQLKSNKINVNGIWFETFTGHDNY